MENNNFLLFGVVAFVGVLLLSTLGGTVLFYEDNWYKNDSVDYITPVFNGTPILNFKVFNDSLVTYNSSEIANKDYVASEIANIPGLGNTSGYWALNVSTYEIEYTNGNVSVANTLYVGDNYIYDNGTDMVFVIG